MKKAGEESMNRELWSPVRLDRRIDNVVARRPLKRKAPTLWETTAPALGRGLPIFIDLLWQVARACPEHRFRVLCTAPKQMPENPWPENIIAAVGPLRTQAEVDEAVPALLALPAARREVVLAPKEAIEVESCFLTGEYAPKDYGGVMLEEQGPRLDAVRVRGGTGSKCLTPMAIAWVRALRDQAVGAGVDFSLSWGRWEPIPGGSDCPEDGRRGYRFSNIDPDNWYQKSRTKTGGCALDGVLYPEDR